ncbi:hypothetical protein [Pedobacter gandavensis]|uniref:nSTAND3 domain-containing NTPase n=1 Tax=Pedobacter gandavensis TaxID=2679963 RepID=UPI0029313367|nr:hypothetical protein [Pedobacter gandavensis]
MDKINWPQYNHDDFELFCNALMTFEFGKSYKPYTAPGRDGGIDGFFSGTYENNTGDWRFQFKFYQSARSVSVSNLKFQLKKEAANLNDEAFFVLATNVDLLPQESAALSEAFQQVLTKTGKDCKIFIWDGAKLSSLFIQYPILSLWLYDGFKTSQLRNYREVYERQLNSKDFEPSSMSNFFIGRQSDLDLLEQFLQSDQTLGIITGEAGIGKTRLALEFFERKVDRSEDWDALVLMNRHIEFDKLRKALSPGKKYIVLIDDAHTFEPSVIADMKAIVDSLQNVKLLLTARKLEAFNALVLLKEYEKQNILNITLSELSRQETSEAFLRYIGNTDYKHYLNQLVTISFGKPILIMAILNAMSKHIQINQIKSQDFLRDYVKNYFETFCVKVLGETGVHKIKSRQLLRTIALLEPFNFSDSEIIGKLSRLLDIDQVNVQTAFRYLIDNDFVNGRYEQSIKPDYYSDILLSDIDQTYVIKILSEFLPFTGNIIVNLSSVDEVSEGSKNNLLQDILTTYVGLIRTAEGIDIVNNIFTTVRTITFIKPDIAKLTIDQYLDCMKIEGHPMALEFVEEKKYNYFSGESTLGKVISMLSYLYESPSNCDYVYRRSFRLYELTEQAQIANIFSFGKKDAIEKFKMQRQDFFVKEFSRKFRKYNSVEKMFGLLCLKSFTALDFTASEWSAVNLDSLNITTYYIPNIPSVKKFRKQLVDTLIKLFQSLSNEPSRSEVFRLLIDIPRGIFATHRNAKSYVNDNEISTVLNFLKSDTDKFDIIDRKEVLEKIYWFQKWGISEELLPLLDDVQEALRPKNLVERLTQLFSKAELSILELPNVEKYVAEKCEEIVADADEKSLATSIVQFLAPQPYPPHYYWSFQDTLTKDYPSYAKELHNALFEHSMQLYSTYASNILGSFYYLHQDESFFRNQVKVLLKQKSVEADNVILSVFARRVPDKTNVLQEDSDLIIGIFDKNIRDNDYMLSMAIQLLFAASHPDAMAISQKFLARVYQKQSEIFFIRLADNKSVTTDQMAELILNHTLQYALTYELERCLNLVLQSKGEVVVFEYLARRYEVKKNFVMSKKTLFGYEFVPRSGSHSHLFDKMPESKMSMFKRALKWYGDLDGDAGHLFYAKDMLDYLQPQEFVNKELADYYRKQIAQFEDDGSRLERILESLSIFHNKDEILVELVIYAFDFANDFQDSDMELYKSLFYQLYSALTTVGIKSGTPGEPFQVDLDLKSLLESFIIKLPEHLPVISLIREALKSVDAEIDHGLDRDNITWQ